MYSVALAGFELLGLLTTLSILRTIQMDTKADLLIGAYEVWESGQQAKPTNAYFAGAGTYAGTHHAWADYIFRRAVTKISIDNREYVPVGNFEKRIRKSFKSDSDEEFFNEATDALLDRQWFY